MGVNPGAGWVGVGALVQPTALCAAAGRFPRFERRVPCSFPSCCPSACPRRGPSSGELGSRSPLTCLGCCSDPSPPTKCLQFLGSRGPASAFLEFSMTHRHPGTRCGRHSPTARRSGFSQPWRNLPRLTEATAPNRPGRSSGLSLGFARRHPQTVTPRASPCLSPVPPTGSARQ